MKRHQIRFGITFLTLGILSVVPALRATEPPKIDTNGDALDEPFALDLGSRTSLPLQTTEKLSLGAVTID